MDTNDNAFRHSIDVDEAEPTADTCLRAAFRLRWQATDLAGSTSAGIVRATSELLDAVATATGADPGSVPDSIHRSATRPAVQIQKAPLRSSSDPPDRAAATRSPGRTDADWTNADRLRLPLTGTSGGSDTNSSDTIGPAR